MVGLPPYFVPPEIWDIQNANERVRLDFPIKEIRNSVENYCNAYNTMIHFEEAAHKKFVQSFDMDDIDIAYAGKENIYYILNDVSLSFYDAIAFLMNTNYVLLGSHGRNRCCNR